MKITTKNDVLKNVIPSFKKLYPVNIVLRDGKNTDDILTALSSEKSLSETKIDEIIGNNSWTEITCDECLRCVEAVVSFSGGRDVEDDEYEPTNVCTSCLVTAINAMNR